jgi:hypothetical protein
MKLLLRNLLIPVAVSILCVVGGRADATSIIGIKAGNDIYIGADSKALIERDIGITQCKIKKMGNVFIAFTGMPSLPASSFNAYGIAAKIFDGKGTIGERVDAFDNGVFKQLQDAFEHMRKSDPNFFARWYADDVVTRIALQIMIAGAEKKGTVLSMLEYRIESPRSAPVKISSIRKDITVAPGSKTPKIVILGMQDAIQSLIQKKDFFTRFDAVRSIREWITAEAEAEPTKVSLPIDILKISPTKAEWIQHKEICPEVDESKILTEAGKR